MGEEEFLAFHIDDPIPAYFVKSTTNISMYIFLTYGKWVYTPRVLPFVLPSHTEVGMYRYRVTRSRLCEFKYATYAML